ncbi:MAG: hypothetical protein RR214_04170 [Synergistaceae bacterium]
MQMDTAAIRMLIRGEVRGTTQPANRFPRQKDIMEKVKTDEV